ncbi:hypothetical protein HPB52_002302 [Rhipicephalus sanguineus]|uniref:Uncharacterized protein n=1 Tax=Rhipicephalus sanguineus TaxID=34632 RepID=A0A9D4PFV0_RHISA|nr:hypothetical protein HPB52_002302 [Rhipicephalus sanguineus]
MRPHKSIVVPMVHKNPVPVTASAVFPGSKQHLQDKDFVHATCHPFYAGFRLIARVQRLTGCCYLENIGCEHYEGVRARRFSSYLLYPLGIWIYLLAVAVVILVDTEENKHGIRDTDLLNKIILLASLVALNLEAALNNAILMFRAPDLVELLHMCGLIELRINVPPYKQREAVRSAWNIIAFQLADTALNMALDIYADFGTLILVERGRKLAPFPMVSLVSYCFLGTTFLAFHGLSARVLLTYFSRSIALYVDCIHTNLDRCLRSWSVPESSKVLLVDHVRAQLALVKKCADLASSMLGPSLLYAYAYSVVLLCASAYYTTQPEFPFRVRLFFFFFFALHYVSIFVLPVEAHRMRNALRMMLYVIKHDDLKFTGCGFFTVDLSTFAARLELIANPADPTRRGNSACVDTLPDLAFVANIANAQWHNMQEDLGSDHSIIEIQIDTGQHTRVCHFESAGKARGRRLRLVEWDAFRKTRKERERGDRPITNIDEWTETLRADVDAATHEVPPEANLQVIDSRLLHMWEAKQALLKRWKRQRHNRTLRRRIAKLDRDTEEHAFQVCRAQWEETCNGLETQMRGASAWRLFRHLLDPEETKTAQGHKIRRLITGAVITYTVVLAQTSESYLRDTRLHPPNITDV